METIVYNLKRYIRKYKSEGIYTTTKQAHTHILRSIVLETNNICLRNVLRRYIYYMKYKQVVKDRIRNYRQERRHFQNELGYQLNLKDPQSFNERIVHKKIHNRNPLLPITADKYSVRNYIRDKLGEKQANEILIPLLFVTDNPENIPFKELPSEYVLKANNASGRNLLVTESTGYQQSDIIENCKRWLTYPYGVEKHEWAYQPITPKIVIEELLETKDGKAPLEIKFFMFNGSCGVVHVDFGRGKDHPRTFFDADWNEIDLKYKYPKGPVIEKPEKFNEMLKIAETLSEDFEFVRIDFYLVDDSIYIGEITHYPGSGTDEFKPRKFDFELGEMWDKQLQ